VIANAFGSSAYGEIGISSGSTQTTLPSRQTATGFPSRLWRRRASWTAVATALSMRPVGRHLRPEMAPIPRARTVG